MQSMQLLIVISAAFSAARAFVKQLTSKGSSHKKSPQSMSSGVWALTRDRSSSVSQRHGPSTALSAVLAPPHAGNATAAVATARTEGPTCENRERQDRRQS